MNEIMVLSLLVGGLIGLIKSQGGLDKILNLVKKSISEDKHSTVYVELAIVVLISLITTSIANNVISVLLVGPIAKHLIKTYPISSSRSATHLSVFSCAVQGLLPYGAQILLASRLGRVSPLSITINTGYCLTLFLIGLLFIFISGSVKRSH
jgi:Na+/H+ antiporter NhaC